MVDLEKGIIGKAFNSSNDLELVKIDKGYGKINSGLSGSGIEDVNFQRSLLFYHINQRIVIYFFGDSFEDLGEDYLESNNKKRKLDNLKKQAQKFGFDLVPCE